MTDATAPGSPLVIYVDDEEANRTVFELSIGSVFTVMTCATPDEVLNVLAERDVAVLVTDMRMPTMSGEQLLRVVKEKFPRTIRMVMTAYSDVEPILRAINEGLVARYIVKPWERTEVIQILRWAIGAWTFSRDSEALQRRLLTPSAWSRSARSRACSFTISSNRSCRCSSTSSCSPSSPRRADDRPRAARGRAEVARARCADPRAIRHRSADGRSEGVGRTPQPHDRTCASSAARAIRRRRR